MRQRDQLRLVSTSSPSRISFQPETKLSGGAIDVEHLWTEFVSAQERSKRTLAVSDGIAAGKAYRRFLEAFTRPNTRGAA
jgi:hypothetical protein